MSDCEASGAPDPESVREALRGVIDPEVGVDVVELGLVERIDLGTDRVLVTLLATSPACPMGPYLVASARAAIARRLPATVRVEVELARSPEWTPARMTAKAREFLGWT